ncbi:hypothetical protein SRHO_G00300120 [Serrasalmus rhombeus]
MGNRNKISERGCASQSKPLSPPRDAVSIATTVSWEGSFIEQHSFKDLSNRSTPCLGLFINHSTEKEAFKAQEQAHMRTER